MKKIQNDVNDNGVSINRLEKPTDRSIFIVGGIFTLLVLAGILIDVIIGNITGGDLSSLPKTAVDRFIQFQDHCLLGLYNLDCLNMINQIMMIPVYLALYVANRNSGSSYSLLALIVFLMGTAIMVAGNTSLTMLDLSNKYAAANSDTQKILFAAAGEAMLAKGSHGSLGVFMGFALPNIAGIIMSLVMLKGKVFGKITAYLGLIGSVLILTYLILVTFIPAVEKQAVFFAMPGGLLSMTWMILFGIKFFQLGSKRNLLKV
ncbi:MAG: DUF4386 family protein [Bacteroidales bacterium]|jgi:hypothetical protein